MPDRCGGCREPVDVHDDAGGVAAQGVADRDAVVHVAARAAGFYVIAQRPPRPGWDTPSRPRTNKADKTPRTLWGADRPDGSRDA